MRKENLLAVVLAILISATGTAAPTWAIDRTQLTEPPKPVLDFTLTGTNGEPFASRELQGKAALLFFGFTHCQSVCPPTMQKLRQVRRSLAAAGVGVDCVLISVDGERDTPEVLAEYLKPFMPGFIGLTGSPRMVRDIAAEFSAVFFKGMSGDQAGGYSVEHTSQVYFVDQALMLRATFYNASAAEMEQVVRKILGYEQ